MASSWLLRICTYTLLISVFFVSTSGFTRNRRHAGLPCPSDCHCSINHTTAITTLQCSSLNFVEKLSLKETALIMSLDLSNSGLKIIDKRLKKLVNLEFLNLSHNKISDLKHFPHLPKLTHLNLRSNAIKSFQAKNLPNSLVYLDVSHNYLTILPKDIISLHLKRIDVHGNPFSCSPESLEIRDNLIENKVHIGGHVICQDPVKFKGKSWQNVVDFDEYFKFQDQEEMLADEDLGSGSGAGILIDEQINGAVETATSDFSFDGSGSEELPAVPVVETEIVPKKIQPIETVSTVSTPGYNDTNDKIIVSVPPVKPFANPDVSTPNSLVPPQETTEPQKQSNLGTNIFLVIFLLCLVTLLIYAILKNKEKKREAKRKRRQEKERQRGIEMKATQIKPSDKQNGNTENVPLMNGQNGSSKPGEANGTSADVETPLTSESNQDSLHPPAPSYPVNPDVKSVKVKAGEILDSVPHTPILITRSRSSDGKHIVVTPNLNDRTQ